MRKKGIPKQLTSVPCPNSTGREPFSQRSYKLLILKELAYSGKGKTSRVLRHGLPSKLKFNDFELAQFPPKDTVPPLAHFGGHAAWHSKIPNSNVALDGSGGDSKTGRRQLYP